MTEKGLVELIYTADESDCEDCGPSYASSWIVRYKGKEYGERARAHCFAGASVDLDTAIIEFLTDEGYAVSRVSECYGDDDV